MTMIPILRVCVEPAIKATTQLLINDLDICLRLGRITEEDKERVLTASSSEIAARCTEACTAAATNNKTTISREALADIAITVGRAFLSSSNGQE